tara:strand:+ start:6426 stop:7790 length:1365 start_codon:yes stop_codon:yes gene_type:complete
MNQQMTFPEGGLASFLTSNMDEFDDSRLVFGRQTGINSMRETAERMAQMGRGGDVHVGHLEHGEGVVPRRVRENNPDLVIAIDNAIANEGADPSAYVVGSETNSINPYTGQREFFFKKLVGGIKKLFKAVAPIVIPMALNFFAPGLGSVAAGFIGSGITGLVQGNSFKDSLKMGLMGGVMGGISSGMQGVMQKGDGSFTKKFGQGFRSGAGINLEKGLFGDKPWFDSSRSVLGRKFNAEAGKTTITPDAQESFGKKALGYVLPKAGPTPEAVSALAKSMQGSVSNLGGEAALKLAREQLTPSFMSKYGGTIAAGTAVAAAAGAFSELPMEEVEDPYDGPSASEIRLAENRNKYTVGVPGIPNYVSMSDTMVTPNYIQHPVYTQQAARGGEMFPRRNGYIAGPGTETSDDIPAMLSDGEFVMTAQAVRGVGNGNRQQGVRKMYDMMRAFEGGAVA